MNNKIYSKVDMEHSTSQFVSKLSSRSKSIDSHPIRWRRPSTRPTCKWYPRIIIIIIISLASFSAALRSALHHPVTAAVFTLPREHARVRAAASIPLLLQMPTAAPEIRHVASRVEKNNLAFLRCKQ
jgi:hypothetical protein